MGAKFLVPIPKGSFSNPLDNDKIQLHSPNSRVCQDFKQAMKVLFVIPYAPSPIRVRPFNFTRWIARRGHNVTLATLWTDANELEALRELQREGIDVLAFRLPTWRSLWNCLVALPGQLPLQAAYSWNGALARAIAERLSGASKPPYDVVHVEHVRGARYGEFIARRLKGSGTSIPIVWDSVDCISNLFRQTEMRAAGVASRWMARLECGRTERLEGKLSRMFDRTLVTSDSDRAALLNAADLSGAGRERVTVLTNGVDLDYFAPRDGAPQAPAAVLLSGKMSYHANVAMVDYFIREVLPLLHKEHQDLEVWIVGKDPPRLLQRLSEDPRITVTGTVQDMRPYLRKATVAAAPLTYGAGIQNKVLEAMACGTPVVASPIVAQSLRGIPGADYLVADQPEAHAQAILALITDPVRRREVGRAGRSYVETHHRWPDIAASLEEIYLGLNGH